RRARGERAGPRHSAARPERGCRRRPAYAMTEPLSITAAARDAGDRVAIVAHGGELSFAACAQRTAGAQIGENRQDANAEAKGATGEGMPTRAAVAHRGRRSPGEADRSFPSAAKISSPRQGTGANAETAAGDASATQRYLSGAGAGTGGVGIGTAAG